MEDYVKDELVDEYLENSLALKGSNGLSIWSFRALRLMHSQMSEPSIAGKITKKIRKSMKTLFTEAGSQSEHANEEFDTFFVVTRNAADSESLDLTELNFEAFTLVQELVG